MLSVDMELEYKEQPQYYFHTVVAQANNNLKSDFLSNIQLQDWQDSFRNLYYMLRKKICHLFHVCTSEFVVTFVGSKKVKCRCYAHISQSTSTLRSQLKENDVNFSMPFVYCEGDAITVDHFSMYDVDNRSKSRLMLCGNNNVHSLYEFLLNFRFTMPSLSVVEVPLIYSGVEFEKSLLYSPKVTYKDVTQADHYLDSIPESWDTPIATHFRPMSFTDDPELDDTELACEAEDEKSGSETEYDDDDKGFYYNDCVPKSWLNWYVF